MSPRPRPRPLSAFRRALRIGRLLAHVLHGLFILTFRFPRLRPAARRETIRRWSARLLRIAGVRLAIRGGGGAPAAGPHGTMLVLNHVSWLDVYAVLAVMPARFVAKSEIRAWPLIGRLVSGAGTLFIERGSRRHARHTNHAIADAMRAGDVIAICPEGTTTEGDRLLPFHAALFQPAVEAGAQVLPLAVRYLDAHGDPTLAAAYVGDTSLASSVWQVVGARGLSVELRFGEEIAAGGADRRDLARRSEQAIAGALGVPAPRHRAPHTAPHPPAASQ